MFFSEALFAVHRASTVLLELDLTETSKQQETRLTRQKKERLYLRFTLKRRGVQAYKASHCKQFDSVPRHNVFSKTRSEKFSSELKNTHLKDRLAEDASEVLCPTVPSSVSSNARLRVQKPSPDWIMKGLRC